MNDNPFIDIDFKVEQQGRNDSMPNKDVNMTHWSCTIGSERGGVVVPVSLSPGDFGDRPPTLEETLGFIAADASGVREHPDIDSWFMTMNAPDDHFDAYAKAHSAIKQMDESMSRRFGPSWVAAIAISAQPDQPVPLARPV